MRFGLLTLLLAATVAACTTASDRVGVLPADVSTSIVSDSTPVAIEDDAALTLPDGYEYYEDATEGFRIALPAGWTPFGPDDLEYADLLSEVGQDEVLQNLSLDDLTAAFEQGGVLMAFDVENAHPEFVDNLNILRLAASPLTASGIATLTAQQYESYLDATVVESTVVTVPAGEAALVKYDLPQLGSEGVSLTITGDVYDWTITISAVDRDTMAIDADVVFDSFETF